jgi:hypothetical protein
MPKLTKPRTKKAIDGTDRGRPSIINDEICAEICGRLACGEPISKISQDPHMPGMTTIYMWLRRHEDFRKQYEEARKDGAHAFADQIAHIIDMRPLEVTDEYGNVKLDPGSIAWQRLRMDGRKWLAAKYLPRVYGERIGVEGVEGGAPIKTEDATYEKLHAILSNMEMKKRAGD